ncbi:OmpA family protein [Catellatospora tritici]|uniref:OmpA family protein n=1 Tax=Catellatospora tritici TaxID=2851566 RepID=UPI001C2D7D06|nr:OmpA family protein [Catellatospora tritici]MBV1854232.1 OmpA family protein [Catellatospora tritici]
MSDRNNRRFSRLVGLTVAVVGLTGIVVAQHIPIRHRIEDNLTGRSEQALAAAGLTGIRVSFIGRDGTLRVASADQADPALAIVRALEGVRVAEAVIPEAPAPTPPPAPVLPSVLVTVAGGKVTLSGKVPDEATRTALAQAATAISAEVDNQVTVDATVSDTGLGSLAPVLQALGKNAADATVELREGALTLTGTVKTQAAKDAIATAATAGGATVIDQMKVEVQQALISLPPVTFLDNRTVLTEAGQAALVKAAQILTDNPTVKVRIEGHTDTIGSNESNLALSRARAKTVVDFLVAHGVSADRLTSVGYGETRLKVPDTTETNRAINRRVEFIVLQ